MKTISRMIGFSLTPATEGQREHKWKKLEQKTLLMPAKNRDCAVLFSKLEFTRCH